MKLKCTAYHPIEAVLDDTKTVIRFTPGEIKEVPDEQVERLVVERYPGMLVKFDEAAEKAKLEEEARRLEVPIKEVDDAGVINKFACLDCGYVAKNLAGLKKHQNIHTISEAVKSEII